MRQKYQNRQEIVHRLSQPGSPSIAVISEETGVPVRLAFKRKALEPN
ncbi:MAG TPA: hypothetical protein VJ385_03360 [Fibrobacteria bacterium]|nr:hypothetical protein [Fibrobacteria bacterium]